MKKLILLVILLFPSIAFGATFSHSLTVGTVGTDVSQLKQFLNDDGLYYGPINATYDLTTKNAVAAFQRQEGIRPANGYFGLTTRNDANAVVAAHPEWTTPISNTHYYKNINGNFVHSPAAAPQTPAGATAQCRDGTFSFSLHHSGSCSHHGGVATWL